MIRPYTICQNPRCFLSCEWLTLWSSSRFRAGSFAIFIVYISIGWHCKILWPVLSFSCGWYAVMFVLWNVTSAEDLSICKSTIEDCIREIDLSILANKLKLNSNKTEIVVFSSSYCPRPALNNLVIASETVDCSTTAKNNYWSYFQQFSVNASACYSCMQVFFLSSSKCFQDLQVSYDTCKILIHAFVTSRIDYCNSLLYGQPKCILQHLQCP